MGQRLSSKSGVRGVVRPRVGSVRRKMSKSVESVKMFFGNRPRGASEEGEVVSVEEETTFEIYQLSEKEAAMVEAALEELYVREQRQLKNKCLNQLVQKVQLDQLMRYVQHR